MDIREDGSKEVLTYAIAPTESAYIWKELLQDVKQRGTEQFLLFISDGLTGINKQIKKYTNRKEQFPHEEALEKFLVSQFESYNQRFATRCHNGFDQARVELLATFTTKEQSQST